MRFALRRVRYMPKTLEPGVLYVSEEFFTAAHLCACGCSTKIRTPLGPTEWSVEDTPKGPTLWPSVGNWQQKCCSHYWFDRGEVMFGEEWSPRQAALGRAAEEAHRLAYYGSPVQIGRLDRLWAWLGRMFSDTTDQ